MALNAALKQLIETKLANTHEPQWVLPNTEVRQAFRNLWTPAITGEVVSIRRIEDVTIPGLDTPIPTRVYTPNGPEPCPLMLYFHGGGYVKGGVEESDAFCRNLARLTQHMVLSVDYRLAPEHRFPAGVEDCYRGYLHALKQGPGETRIRSGFKARICSMEIWSFRCTCISTFNSPRYCTRL